MKVTRLGDLASAMAADVRSQGEIGEQIRELVHRPSVFVRSVRRAYPNADANTFVESISGPTLENIDRVIAELQSLRAELLRRKKHIQVEFRDYENAHENASASLKTVDSILAQWKRAVACESDTSSAWDVEASARSAWTTK